MQPQPNQTEAIVFWTCTTLNCDGRKEMPRRWRFCPLCGGELAEVTFVERAPVEAAPRTLPCRYGSDY